MTTSTIERTTPEKVEDTDDLWHRGCRRCEHDAVMRGAPIPFLCGKTVPALSRRRESLPTADLCVVCQDVHDAGGCTIHPRLPR